MEKVRYGIIGLGNQGNNYRTTFFEVTPIDNGVLTALCDINPIKIDAVKEKYSVAVDTISKEYRLVGEYRLQKYASFLMERYFPIHDQQALMDGELMYQYAIGNATKSEVDSISKRAELLLNKYVCLSKI